MKTSAAGLRFLADEEGEAKWDPARKLYFPYKDFAGYPTIGVGHLIKPGEDFSGGITPERVMQLLEQDVFKCEVAIDESVKVPLSQHMFDCLVSWSFNCGVGVLRSSTLVRQLNSGHPEQVPQLLLAWCHAGGKFSQALYNRRQREGHLWGMLDDGPAPRVELTDADRAAAMGQVAESLDGLSKALDTAPEPLADEPTSPATPAAKLSSRPPPAATD